MLEAEVSTAQAMPMPNMRPSRRAVSCSRAALVADLPSASASVSRSRRCPAASPRGLSIGKFVRAHEIAQAQLRRDRCRAPRAAVIHHALEREIELRPTETAIEPARHLVGDDDADYRDRDIAHAIRAAQGRVHAVERRRIRRAQIGADILDLLEAQPEQRAVAAKAPSTCVTRPEAAEDAARCSSRSSIHFTGRPSLRLQAPISTI